MFGVPLLLGGLGLLGRCVVVRVASLAGRASEDALEREFLVVVVRCFPGDVDVEAGKHQGIDPVTKFSREAEEV